LHWNGLSIDGTTEYLDALKAQFPDNITIYRPPAGKFWDGKREMVNAPLSRITEDCLLWQVDADELWTAAQMIRTRALFLVNPDKTAALFYCHYFVGPELVITSRDTYGNNSSYEWLRVWRYRPGDRWAAHEPPRLQRGDKNVGAINPFRHAETEAMGLVFQHFGYAVEAQVRFKESYYGYAGAVEQWRRLQETKNFPQRLSNHFAWVTDAAMVNRAGRLGITRLAPPEWFGAAQPENHAGFGGAQRILFVRTDSIGDAVLASAMLEPIRKKHPHAKLAVLCQHQVAELYTACPYVDSVICYDRKKMSDLAERAQILAEITNFKPDEILNSVRSRDLLSNELTQGFRGARHIAIEGDLDHIWTSDHVRSLSGYEQIISSPGKFKPELARHEDFLRGLGIQAGHLQPVVWTRPADEILADAFFKREKLDPAKTIAVFPGASLNIRVYYGYAEALKTLDDFRFLVFGDAAQSGLAVELEQQLPGRTVNLCGRSTLRETIALLRRCRLYVGAESAGAHIACAVGVPNVVLLGGGHFGRFMPYSPLTSAVSLPLACFGCNWRCTHKYAHCVKDVSAQVLAEAIRQTLAKPAPRPRLFLQSTGLWKASTGLPQWQMPDLFVPADQVETILVAPGHSDFPPARKITGARGRWNVWRTCARGTLFHRIVQ
jgi:ADP-heptose:LPS heptosyltransferase